MTLDIEAVFFDWGGTLAGIAREAAHWPVCAHRAAQAVLGQDASAARSAAEDLASRFVAALDAARHDPEHREIDTRSILAEWLAGLGADSIDLALNAFWREWVGILDPIKGAAETLGALKRRGYRLGLVSNVAAPLPHARAELDRLGLLPWFDGQTLSSVVGRRKPHPIFYASAMDSLFGDGLRPQPDRILFVGDGPVHDVAEPRQRGMKTALVRYDDLPWPAEQLRDAQPDLHIEHVRELLDVLPGAHGS